ncbi:xanthine dehydrogenase family protein molybdopterin-binding subunit [Rhodoplanes roseus]|uniref:Carbon monoxide dehydrogenase n=1 Tax=Rhodoplanes roseus TaxID=29409 RepID=A0A327LD67_9BRAD|nr:molybdopterin cofactor-binding domain-containing protein [Rhodoplanes roseus]RAI45758.1 carbon monoxide dehydrogenase [Rhodoplanes roseus]
MTTSPDAPRLSRRTLLEGGALMVGFALGDALAPVGALAQGAARSAAAAAATRILDPKEVDAYLAINGDGTVTVWCGKVDLGQGLRVAIPQIAADELGIGLDRITYVEGDTALTPDQGRTAGSYGIARGGMQIRQAAATARKALVERAAHRLGVPADELVAADGAVRPRTGGAGLTFAELIGGARFDLKLDPKAPLKDPESYTLVGKPLPRPDVPAKCTGTLTYMHDHTVPGMLHARVIRPASVGAHLVSVDESSVADLPGVRVVRIQDFLAVVAADEWTAIKAAGALKAQWSAGSGLPAQAELPALLRASPGTTEQVLTTKSSTDAAPPPEDARSLTATYFWPMQSHASIGPSCAIADVSAAGATIWTASQGTHGNQATFARFLGLPKDKVRLIYLDGAGCYGMNSHEDAAADAAVLSRAVGAPVRVQWSRQDELGWDPKGPPQLIDIAGTIDAAGYIRDWRTDMWIPENTRGLPSIPLLAPEAAGLPQTPGLNSGMISQNGDPPYRTGRMQVVAHWLKTAPLRPAPLRSPGKPANCFAVESFLDELAAAAVLDPLQLRLSGLTDQRGKAVVEKIAEMMSWEQRPSPGPNSDQPVGRGRGLAYIHYKHDEAHVAIGMEVAVERASGAIRVERVFCAHDCGQIVNPDGVRAQVEGSIIQTLSRVLKEEVTFDRERVTSVDWSSYSLLTFSEVPKLDIALIDRPTEPPLGAGEAACAPVAAALANAVFDATGARLRTVPFTPERVKAALGGQASMPRT